MVLSPELYSQVQEDIKSSSESVFELVHLISEPVLEQIGRSSVKCQHCGYSGPISIISTHYGCKCGGIPQGTFPELRIIESNLYQDLLGYKLGGIILESKNVILANESENKFDIVHESGFKVLSCNGIPDLLLEIDNDYFKQCWGGIEFFVYYKSNSANMETKVSEMKFEELPLADPGTSVLSSQLQYKEEGNDEHQIEFSDISFKEKEKIKVVRIGKKATMQVQININVPSAIIFAVFVFLLLQSLIHISISYYRISNPILEVDYLQVLNSTFIGNPEVETPEDLKQIKGYSPKFLHLDSVESNVLGGQYLNVESEYSNKSYVFSSLKPTQFTANQLKISNLETNSFTSDAKTFETNIQTQTVIPELIITGNATVDSASFEHIEAENLRFTKYLDFLAEIANINTKILNSRVLESESFEGELPVAQELNVTSASINKLIINKMNVGNITVEGALTADNISISQDTISVLHDGPIQIDRVIMNNDIEAEMIKAQNQLTVQNATLQRATIQNLAGTLAVNGTLTTASMSTGNAECVKIGLNDYSIGADEFLMNSITVSDKQECTTVNAETSKITKT